MKNLVLLLMLALLLQGCLEQPQSETNSGLCSYALCFADRKPSVSNSCTGVDAAEMAYTQSLLDLAINSPTNFDGEVHPDATFNVIEEVGRRGCNESLEGLLDIAESVEAAKSINAGIISYAHLGPRKLEAVIAALGTVVNPSDGEAMEFLNRMASENMLIQDGRNGRSLQTAAQNSISQINDGVGNYIKQYHYYWNTIPACSTNYLLTNGNRTSFIANWTTYFNQIQNLTPTNPILITYAYEPFYCDGYNGYKVHEIAINTLELSTADDAINFTKSMLDNDPLRGSITGTIVMTKLINREDLFDVSDIEDMSEYLRLDSGHPDETVRSEIVNFIVKNCSKHLFADSECSAAIENSLKTSAKRDPYYIVRLRAQQGLDYLALVKKTF